MAFTPLPSFPMAACSAPSIPSASLPFPPIPKPHNKRRKPPPISISTKLSHLDPLHLRDLLASSNLSCHRFPILGADGRPAPVDLPKLRTALAHSFVVVSVFCRSKFLPGGDRGEVSGFGFEDLFESVARQPDSDHRLVGFGRAVSDGGLTASIHDVVVIPSFRRLGIGRKIIERITRVLASRGIYDISALCSEKERLFFEACGFGKDSLGSTTMMYTRTPPTIGSQDDLMVRSAGRLLLLVTPCGHQCRMKRTDVEVDDDRSEAPAQLL